MLACFRLRTENEVAKETEPVEETGGQEERELEPEDKEEKPIATETVTVYQYI
jgi:hypothetical protein